MLALSKRIRLLDLILVAACLVWSLYAGKDLNWDLRNYHYYLPYSLLEGSVSRDFFPASIQSYLNPLAYFPFYWMVSANWPSPVIASILGLVHSINLMLLFRICRLVGGRCGWTWYAFFLGAAAPLFWTEVGTSYNDVTICVFVLSAVYLALKGIAERPTQQNRYLFWCGIFLGIATGLKLTFAPFAIAGGAFIFFGPAKCWTYLTKAACYIGGSLIGAVLAGGYWHGIVWSEFGNPVFPFFNGIFCSQDYLCENISTMRFIPSTIGAALKLPFEMATPISWVYTETTSPDIRFAAAFVVLAIVIVARLLFRGGKIERLFADASPNVGVGVVVYFLVCYLGWCLTSANGRYGMPLGLLVGVVLAQSIFWLDARYVRIGAVLVLCLQIFQMAFAGDARWSPSAWTRTWFELQVPPQLQSQPYLYMSVGTQTNSFVVPFLHSKSAFVNIRGQASLSPTSAGADRVHRLRLEYGDRVRILANINAKALVAGAPSSAYLTELDLFLRPSSLRIDPSDCQLITGASEQKPASDVEPLYHVLSCRAVAASFPREEQEKLSQASDLMDRVEAACPNVFNPKGATTELSPRGYKRAYVGSEVSLFVSYAGQVFLSKVRVPNDLELGTVDDWKPGSSTVKNCPRIKRSDPWFSLADASTSGF